MALAAARDSSRAPSIPDVLAEHLEELGFLSLQRRKLLFAEDCTPSQFVRHSRRIEAHWAGLCVAPQDSVQIARVRLEDPVSAWDVMACARTWIELGNATLKETHDCLAAANESAAAGWREGLRRVPARIVFERFPLENLENASAAVAILLDAHSWHGLLSARRAEEAARSELPSLRRSIARHAPAIAGAIQGARLVDSMLEDVDEGVRRAAHWSLMFADPVRAFEHARRLSQNDDPFANLLLELFPDDTAKTPKRATARPDEDREEPLSMAKIWRRVVRGQMEDVHGQRREVPDGFFTAVLSEEAIAGE